ncbi:hypothetical protein NIES25_26210 [Nostoc linckia NIES-25]|nr:hypothetical protein NIES25_26210 [Nostoc linckia NIES-25]
MRKCDRYSLIFIIPILYPGRTWKYTIVTPNFCTDAIHRVSTFISQTLYRGW